MLPALVFVETNRVPAAAASPNPRLVVELRLHRDVEALVVLDERVAHSEKIPVMLAASVETREVPHVCNT